MKKSLTIFLSLSIIFILLILFHPKHDKAKTTSPLASQYQTLTIVPQSVQDSYQTVGTVTPKSDTHLAAQVNATITRILVTPGMSVQKNDLLIQLDSREYEAQVAQAKEAVNAAEAVTQETRNRLNRMKKMLKPGYVTAQQFDQTNSLYTQSEANLTRAKEALKSATILLGYCKILAPANGVILDKFANVGDQASAGEVLLRFQSNESPELVTEIPEDLLQYIHLQDKLPVTVDTLPEKFTGTVKEITPAIDPNTRSFTVKVTLPNVSEIHPGLFATLEIPTRPKTILAIPSQLIQHRGELTLVSILKSDEPEKVLITTGRKYGDLTEVLSGLNKGDQLITTQPLKSE